MNSLIRKSLRGGVAALFTVLAAGTVLARSAPPLIGHARNLAFSDCFQPDIVGTISNTCSGGAIGFQMPLLIDTSGSKVVTINATPGVATQESDGKVCCSSVPISASGEAGPASGDTCTPFVSGAQSFSLRAVNVPSGGALSVECSVSPGASINTVNWPQ